MFFFFVCDKHKKCFAKRPISVSCSLNYEITLFFPSAKVTEICFVSSSALNGYRQQISCSFKYDDELCSERSKALA